MEGGPNIESMEDRIDKLLEDLAQKEEMDSDQIITDIIAFAPNEGNELANSYYLEELAEKLGISIEEMNEYALKKAEE